MVSEVKQLIDKSHDLIRTIKELRDALLDYQEGCERLLQVGELDRLGSSTIERVELVRFADKRERLAAALEAFEVSRRRARVALIAVAEDEGSTISEVARTLGLSRQLLSRQSKQENR